MTWGPFDWGRFDLMPAESTIKIQSLSVEIMIYFGHNTLISAGISFSIVILCLTFKMTASLTMKTKFRKFGFFFSGLGRDIASRNVILEIVIKITWSVTK